LQQGEGRGVGLARAPGQQLAIDHRAVGPVPGGGQHLGEALAHQLLAARPDPDLALALDHLGPDAVVLPLGPPAAALAQGLGPIGQRLGQEEG
jgi:hypothetical protein